ncbi:MAG: hypothetical protein KAS01_00530 [Candidatus Pacebacteria bacterium]|nr:hypothetical protein [Candidatus Paceibacterota bacterium]
MKIIQNINILALGAESCGRFAVFSDDKIFISKNFGNLLQDDNFKNYKKAVLKQIKIKKPDVILTDLHPLYVSTVLGEELSNKYKIQHIKIQHHLAHIFSAIGDKLCCPEYNECQPELIEGFQSTETTRDSSTPLRSAQNDSNNFRLDIKYSLPNTFYGIASDGTGLGFDGNIWGGEVFKFLQEIPHNKKTRGFKNNLKIEALRQSFDYAQDDIQNYKIERIGSLEEQTMLGGDLAVKEPARMLISILNKFLPKEKIYENVKKHYSKNEFELLYNQLQQNFNCQTTTSTGRILDAVSVLLDFAKNERKSKHESIKILEKNSAIPHKLAPKITFDKDYNRYILQTTPLFEYLLKNINKNKKRLAATAQLYLAQGFLEIINKNSNNQNSKIFFAGGIANNQIMSSYLENNNVYTSKKVPRGDEGLAFGQIIYCLSNYIN